MSETTPKPAKRVLGVVKSDKMDKTITVNVDRLVKHPKYAKFIKRQTRYMAQDAHNDAHAGDLVEIEQTRPLSKNKCWRLVRVVRRAPSALVGLNEN